MAFSKKDKLVNVAAGLALGFGLLGLLGAWKPGAGESGTTTGRTDGLEYEWRVIPSEDGAEFPFAAQARTAGTEGWTVEQIVAWGPTSGDAKANLMAWLDTNT